MSRTLKNLSLEAKTYRVAKVPHFTLPAQKTSQMPILGSSLIFRCWKIMQCLDYLPMTSFGYFVMYKLACGNRCCSTACIPNNESWWQLFLSMYMQKWHFCELRKLYNLYSCNHFLVAQPWPCRCDAITVHCLYAQSQVEIGDNELTMIHFCFHKNFWFSPKTVASFISWILPVYSRKVLLKW